MRLLATIPVCVALYCAPQYALSQTLLASTTSSTAMINGIVIDRDGGCIPGAAVSIVGEKSDYKSSSTADASGHFAFDSLDAKNTYRLTITAPGFSEWDSKEIALQPGQNLDLDDIEMTISAVETSVTAVFAEHLAAQQVKAEETQRYLGVVPNFYVVYDRNNVVPMPASLKFHLAIRAETDVVTFTGAALLAGIHQASDTPAFQQGFKGYAQRYGAAYAGGVSDILIGGAILPSLLHQDPRYFYSGRRHNATASHPRPERDLPHARRQREDPIQLLRSRWRHGFSSPGKHVLSLRKPRPSALPCQLGSPLSRQSSQHARPGVSRQIDNSRPSRMKPRATGLAAAFRPLN